VANHGERNVGWFIWNGDGENQRGWWRIVPTL